ncbi:MAG: ankyrin repeat domain-containing protein [Deferribacteraceae bacterium]|nr:ankyrin repeat domain-containing protein [Deferribacteraceae bacterium]
MDKNFSLRALMLVAVCILFSAKVFAMTSSELFSSVARGDNIALQSWVLNGGELNIRDSRGNTPLMLAAEDGKVEMVSLLISKGANVELENYFGYTPLWAATSGKHPLVITQLLNAGADSSRANRYGTSVNDYVKAKGFDDIYKYTAALPQSNITRGPNSSSHIPLWEKQANASLLAGDFTNAELVLKVTADKGDPYARYMLGKFYLDSGYIDMAIVSLSAAAEAGVLAAQIDLSRYYLETMDRHPIYTALGFKYQKMAADNWYAPAILETGKCYMYGVGTQMDQQAAYKYFRLAASLGLMDAYYFMGAQRYYNLGLNGMNDGLDGMSEIISAAEAGSAEAKAQLLRFKTEDIFEAFIKIPNSREQLNDYLSAQGAVNLETNSRCDYYDISKITHPDYGVYKLGVCNADGSAAVQLVFNVYRDMQPVYKEYLINYQLKRPNVQYIIDGEQ